MAWALSVGEIDFNPGSGSTPVATVPSQKSGVTFDLLSPIV
jgi:hypothetical protein